MTIRIGANPIGWSNDDLRTLGGDTPLETCLAQAKEAGFEGMELGHKFPREAGALKAALAPFGLDCVSGWHSAELLTRDVEAEMTALRPHLDLLKAMGSTVLVYAETSNAIHGDIAAPLSRRPKLSDWTQWTRRLTEVAERVQDEGLTLVYHHHMGTIVQSEADIDAMMTASGAAVRLLLDTGHATWGGADPVALARRWRARIAHVHAKDVRADVMARAQAQDWSFLKSVVEGVYTVPGDGMVDYVSVFRALPGYAGWVVVEAEQDPQKANPLRYAKMGHANLVRDLRAAGLM
jgi:myo-inosose-2 dehydratase